MTRFSRSVYPGQLDHLPGVVLVQRHAHVVAAERLGDGHDQ